MADPAGPKPFFFDLWSRFYDAPLVQRLTYRPVHDAVLRALRELAPKQVLDVGCGTGLFTTRLRGELAGAQVVGCDFSHGMLREAAGHGGRRAWVQGDGQRLPFRDASFDALLSTEAFHWFPDQERALADFHRVLAPGGRIFVAFVNPPVELLSELSRLGSRLIGEPFYWPTRETMRARVEAAGFRLLSQSRIQRIPFGVLFPPVLTVAARP
jgi:ubiquinone/menaquinone biosynthesis C-methylase UbiE